MQQAVSNRDPSHMWQAWSDALVATYEQVCAHEGQVRQSRHDVRQGSMCVQEVDAVEAWRKP
eukprot:7566781-Alexandrium_andersonii.AAC.1